MEKFCAKILCKRAEILRKKAGLEHFHKYCSHSVMVKVRAVFLNFGFVSAQLQGFSNLRLRQSLAKTQKSSLRMTAVFIQKLLTF
jgi:hypothetical protein